ncbi:MAG: uracil-DNA glycosylase [Paraglaciecola polaris]|uniref:uracil-DNA glycosylase n=1 Tax=Paraglaciecola polaris TaxID=222814 RepID=UPI003001042D|tara:strand:- start:50525 stop:51193 length:669 start_codon:yes stop_codon:yes gene_type:complete
MTSRLTWQNLLSAEKHKAYYIEMMRFIRAQRDSGKVIYPLESDVFNAFTCTEFNQIKVVILGQDPYHGPTQAHGLSFSVQDGVKPPPSLKNIYKALAHDFPNFVVPTHGCLQSWAQQGVFLLNTVLTVEQGKAHSHAKIGWQRFTDTVIKTISEYNEGVIFLLWGSHAQQKSVLINEHKHHVLTAVHPSPLSAYRGFFECGHFVKTNNILLASARAPINWQV